MASSTEPHFIANRYEIRNVVGRGGMGVVYRCYDHVARTEIALKQMLVTMKSVDNDEFDGDYSDGERSGAVGQETIAVATPDTWKRQSPFVGMRESDEEGENPGSFRLALSHEFETLAHLRHPNIVSVLDYGFDEHKLPFFTMPLIQSPQDIMEAAKSASLGQKLTWLAQMLQALAYLHHHNIIHRDLKPDNALLAADETVKLLDFGLAVIRERADELDDDDDTMIAGTIPYMAPELIQGGEASTRTDLYALGMIAFELLAGYYPFEFDGVGDLVMKIVTQEPPVDDLNVSEPLRQWVEQLVKLDEDERADDALTMLLQLSEITESTIPIETKTIQESYLQTAKFVGRDEELKMLIDGLKSTLNKDGKSFLLVGDIGVGKTRLLNELRILALVNGFRVLQGSGANEQTPYHILREPIKRLLLSTPINAMEANILKTLLPDLETILGRTVPEVMQDETSKFANQLSTVILNLFKDHKEPTLLILDDLHLAPESITIVSNLMATVPNSNLMIVVSQRPDATVDIASTLSEAHIIELERLSDAEVEKLAKSILGDVGMRADVQHVLKREAQGNVNFLLEVLRALLEEVKHLRDIAMMRLPQEITAGGINSVLAQRLEKITGDERHLFELMAAAGLQIDLKLLSHLADAIGISDENWLTTLANHVIVEREGEIWQISHDRLRLVALDNIPDKDLRQLHLEVAFALEHIYPDTIEKAGMIAYHWNLAGNDERERPYLLDAADYALRLNSFQDAVRLYRRALELRDEAASDEVAMARVHVSLGESLFYIGNYQESQHHLNIAVEQFGDEATEIHARALSLLADAYYRSADPDNSVNYAMRALELAREIGSTDIEIRSLSRLGTVGVSKGEFEQAEEYYITGLKLAEEHNNPVGKTMLTNNYGILFGYQGKLDLAEEWFRTSLDLAEANTWLYRAVSTVINLGVLAMMQNKLEPALAYYERALVLGRSIGDRRNTMIALLNLGKIGLLQKDYRHALAYLDESLSIAQTIGDRTVVPEILHKKALVIEGNSGDIEITQELLMQSLEVALSVQATPSALLSFAELARLEHDGMLAVSWAQYVVENTNENAESRKVADKVLSKLERKLDEDEYKQAIADAANVTLEDALQ